MKKRYAVYPGPVRSKNDGALHFISYQRLVRLYRVRPAECVDMSDPSSYRGVDFSRLIALVPKRSGNYTTSEDGKITARLRRKVRRLALAWNVCFNTPDGEKVRAILGTEKEAMQVGRLSAHVLKATSWKTVPFPEFNSKYAGKLEPAGCPDWALVRPPGEKAAPGTHLKD